MALANGEPLVLVDNSSYHLHYCVMFIAVSFLTDIDVHSRKVRKYEYSTLE